MKNKTHFRLDKVVFITFFLIYAMVWTNCGKEEKPSEPSQPGVETKQPPPAKSLPDLMISAVEVLPAQPQAGVRFTVNVYVRNAGQAPSGQYDLAMHIKDVSRNLTYPIGTFRREPLKPGENVPAYSSGDLMVNESGSHQLYVEIQPFLFEDGNTENNVKIWAFTVQ